MQFREIKDGHVTLEFDPDEAALLAAASAFTAATMIARVHGDMPQTMREHLARVHKRITTD